MSLGKVEIEMENEFCNFVIRNTNEYLQKVAEALLVFANEKLYEAVDK